MAEVTENLTFTARWEAKTALITMDANSGTINPSAVSSDQLQTPDKALVPGPIGQTMVAINQIAHLFIAPTVENSQMILVGVTESDGVVGKIYGNGDSLPEGITVYGSASVAPSNVETYLITEASGGATFYAVWAYDKNNHTVPDYLDAPPREYVIVTVDANGGEYNPAAVQDPTQGTWASSMTFEDSFEKNYVITWPTIEAGLATQFRYPHENVVLLGVTTDKDVKRGAYACGDTLSVELLTGAYTITEPVTFYAVWAEDKNDNGVLDYLEGKDLILDFNGGRIPASLIGSTGEGLSFEKQAPEDDYYSRMRASGQLSRLPGERATVFQFLTKAFDSNMLAIVVWDPLWRLRRTQSLPATPPILRQTANSTAGAASTICPLCMQTRS